MAAKGVFTLTKQERICSRKLIEKLFDGGNSRSLAAYPLRVVYMPVDADEPERHHSDKPSPQAMMMTIVSKRHLRHAVARNRAKRLMREAYRLNKHIVTERLAEKPQLRMAMAFIWMSHELHTGQEVNRKMINLLTRIGENI